MTDLTPGAQRPYGHNLDEDHRVGPPGAAERDAAIERTTESNDRWLAATASTIYSLSFSLDELTTDDVWRLLDSRGVETPPGFDPKAMGAAMQAAARKGWIVRTDRTRPTERPEAHRSPKRIWRSVSRARIPAPDAQTSLDLAASEPDSALDATAFGTSLDLLERALLRANFQNEVARVWDEIDGFLRTHGRLT